MEQTPDSSDYEAQLDHLVDTQGISYVEARRQLGEPPYELYEQPKAEIEPVSPVATRLGRKALERPRSGHGPQYGEEEGIGSPDGLPHYYQSPTFLDEDQKRINRQGIAKVRQALERTQRDQL